LLDRFWGPAIAALVLLPAAAACVVFTLPASLPVYAAAAGLLGAATGMELDVLAFLAARYFGLRDFSRVYARLYMFLAAPAGLAPLAFGGLFDLTGSYRLPFLLAAALLVLAAGALLTLGRYPPAFASNRRDEG
jgi:sugar phosphate permease